MPVQRYAPPVSAEDLSERATAKCGHSGWPCVVLTKPGPGKVFLAAQPFSFLILTPLRVHRGHSYHLRLYLRILDLRMTICCAAVPLGGGWEEHETAQPACSQQSAMVLGFLGAVQWTKLSSRAMAAGGHLEHR